MGYIPGFVIAPPQSVESESGTYHARVLQNLKFKFKLPVGPLAEVRSTQRPLAASYSGLRDMWGPVSAWLTE